MSILHPLTDGALVALWEFSESLASDTVLDSTANNLDLGAANGGMTVVTSGVHFGKARQGVGGGGRYEISNNTALLNPQLFTVSALVYYDGNVGAWPKVVHNDHPSKPGSWTLEMAQNVAKFEMGLWFTDNSSGGCQDQTVYPAGWYYVVWSWDGTASHIYVNGALTASGTEGAGKTIDYAYDYFVVGVDRDDTAEYWRGLIDEIGLYNEAKGLTWVQAAYLRALNAPYLENQNPAASATGVAVGGPIQFSINDLVANHVGTGNITVEIEGDTIFASSTFAAGWTTSSHQETPDGRHDFILWPDTPFGYSTEISVRVLATDAIGSSLDTTYTFTTATQAVVSSPVRKDGHYWLIGDDRDNALDDNDIARDGTIASVVRFRLLCHRGQWVYDRNIGSRLYTIKTIKQGLAEAPDMVNEALQDLLDSGELISATVTDVQGDNVTGALAISVQIVTPADGAQDLGPISIRG